MTTIEMIPIDKIRVLNPRARNKKKWREIVDNIGSVGLKKPITASRRTDGEVGYDLICGEGRVEALKALGHTHVPAIIRDVPPEDRYLMSLVENIARRHLGAVELVRQIAALRDRGYSMTQVASKIGLTETYVSGLLRLLDKGEAKLLRAVEHGDVPISVAVVIAQSDDASVQRALAEAYERGELKGRALMNARQLIERRGTDARRKRKDGGRSRSGRHEISTDELLRTFRKETAKQRLLVKKARLCERQLVFVVGAVRVLFADTDFVRLTRGEHLDKVPKFLAEEMSKS